MKRTFLILFCLFFSMLIFAQSGRALIIIDIQDFYFPGGDAELVEPGKAAANAGKILEVFRENGELVIHIRHNYEPGGTINKAVAPAEGEKVISKNYANSFRETELLDYLKENEIKELVITGMQTHMCVEATTRAASDYGYQCTVVSDACTTRDLKFGDRVTGWEDVHYSTLSTLKGGYAKIVDTQQFLEAGK
jgi:nicotinamidase-related amidase